jgi:hypothetical protein
MSTPAVALFRASTLPLQATSLVPSTLPGSQVLSLVRSAESKHPSLRIAYFLAVSRHDEIENRPGSDFSHTDAVITCQEADFLHPSEIVGAHPALPRVFASVII